MISRTVPFSQWKHDRLGSIEQQFQLTIGWTKQLADLYHERKMLRIDVSRMEKKTTWKKSKKKNPSHKG